MSLLDELAEQRCQSTGRNMEGLRAATLEGLHPTEITSPLVLPQQCELAPPQTPRPRARGGQNGTQLIGRSWEWPQDAPQPFFYDVGSTVNKPGWDDLLQASTAVLMKMVAVWLGGDSGTPSKQTCEGTQTACRGDRSKENSPLLRPHVGASNLLTLQHNIVRTENCTPESSRRNLSL